MRLIGNLDNEQKAKSFSDYLYSEGIENETATVDNGTHEIWILAEEEIDQAKSLLEEFNSDPENEKYQAAAEFARRKKEKEKKALEDFQKKMHGRDKILLNAARPGLLTLLLLGICVAVALITRFGEDHEVLKHLTFTSYTTKGDMIHFNLSCPELRAGQVWRTITPAFIHFGFMHLIFNMMWLFDLGNMIEKKRSVWLLLSLVVFIAVASNTGQFLVSKHPQFGGMSGVVYGLAGYIWMRGRLEPGCGLFMHKRTFMMMMIWFVVCFMPGMPIANGAHAVGLGLGLALGYISAWTSVRRS